MSVLPASAVCALVIFIFAFKVPLSSASTCTDSKTVVEKYLLHRPSAKKSERLDEATIVAVGRTGIYHYISKENHDVLKESLISFRQRGMSPDEIAEELRRSLRECKGN